MKTFRDYLKEDVVPTAIVQDGSIDLEREVVRAQINSSLASVLADASVTPYNSLVRISKVLSYFNIILPKRVYLDGEKGIEAIELRQFGDRMGMNDQGEFIKEVPGKFYLFIQYWRTHPNVAPYAATANFISSTAGMFKVAAKIVDKVELDRLIDMAEVSLAESAESRQAMAHAKAPKEEPHTALGDCDCSQGDSPSTKSAVSVMMRRKDKKLSADSLDEEKQEHIYTHEKGPQYGTVIDHGGKFFTRRKVGMYWRTKSHNSKDAAIAHLENDKKKKLKEDALEEAMTRKQKDMAVRRFMSHDPEAGERILKMGKKDREEKKSFASAKKEINRLKEEEQIDEVSLEKSAKTARLRNIGAERSAHASPYDYSPHIDVQRRKAGKTVDRIERKHGTDAAKRVSKAMDKDTDKVWRGQMDELKKSTIQSYEDKAYPQFMKLIKKSKDPYLTDLSPKERKTAQKRGEGLAMAANRLEEKFGVYRKGGSIGEKPSTEPHKTFDSAEEAKAHAKGMNKQLSPGEKKYYRIKYHVKPIKEEQIDEGRMPPPVIAHKQKLASMSDKEFAEKHGHKSEKALRDMAARHGYGFDKATKTGSDHYVKRVSSAKQIDEKHLTPAETRKKEEIVMSMKKGLPGFKERYGKRAKEVMYATATKRAKQVAEDTDLDEAMGSAKKNYGLRKMKTKAKTIVRRGLGKERPTQTILVTRKGDPHAAAGGGVLRIPKDKYDPKIHNMASE